MGFAVNMLGQDKSAKAVGKFCWDIPPQVCGIKQISSLASQASGDCGIWAAPVPREF